MELINKAKLVYQISKEYANLSYLGNISMGKSARTDYKFFIGNDKNILIFLVYKMVSIKGLKLYIFLVTYQCRIILIP